jgi:protein CWC15
MTTAHRPTFDPARGKEALRGPAYHQRLLPAHTHLKHRQAGQGGAADAAPRDLRAELLRAEAVVKARKAGVSVITDENVLEDGTGNGGVKPKLAIGANDDGHAGNETQSDNATRVEEDDETKRRRLILEEARDIDADSVGTGSDEDDVDESDDDDEEDEEAELMRELAKIKAERAAQKQKEEDEAAAIAEEQRVVDIARGNPLLDPMRGREETPGASFGVKRRWDDDVVFRNQGRGTEEKGKRREFVNDLLRSDFHKKFMVSYVEESRLL